MRNVGFVRSKMIMFAKKNYQFLSSIKNVCIKKTLLEIAKKITKCQPKQNSVIWIFIIFFLANDFIIFILLKKYFEFVYLDDILYIQNNLTVVLQNIISPEKVVLPRKKYSSLKKFCQTFHQIVKCKCFLPFQKVTLGSESSQYFLLKTAKKITKVSLIRLKSNQ